MVGKGEIVTNNFSFSHNVFHSYTSLVCQNAALCGIGLNSEICDTCTNFGKEL